MPSVCCVVKLEPAFSLNPIWWANSQKHLNKTSSCKHRPHSNKWVITISWSWETHKSNKNVCYQRLSFGSKDGKLCNFKPVFTAFIKSNQTIYTNRHIAGKQSNSLRSVNKQTFSFMLLSTQNLFTIIWLLQASFNSACGSLCAWLGMH